MQTPYEMLNNESHTGGFEVSGHEGFSPLGYSLSSACALFFFLGFSVK